MSVKPDCSRMRNACDRMLQVQQMVRRGMNAERKSKIAKTKTLLTSLIENEIEI